MRTKFLVPGVLSLSALVLAGCAVSGPLTDLEGATTCVPAREGADVFFGAPLSNTGAKEITILDVTAKKSTNTATVDFGVDQAAHVVGAAYYPDDSADTSPESLASVKSMVAPKDVIIKADHTAGLLIKVVPQDPAADATVSEIKIKYQVAGTSYEATDTSTYLIAPEICS